MGRDTVKDFANMGRTLSRKALDNMGGPDQFRTKIVQTPNGPARVRTHGGLPRSYPLGAPEQTEQAFGFGEFQATPTNTDYTSGYGESPLHRWKNWGLFTIPPSTASEGGKNALKPYKLLDDTLGNQTWFSEKVLVSGRVALLSWRGTPWRYGAYSMSAGSASNPTDNRVDLFLQSMGQSIASTPFAMETGRNTTYAEQWKFDSAFLGMQKAVWLNKTKIDTSQYVWGAGIFVDSTGAYLRYVTRIAPFSIHPPSDGAVPHYYEMRQKKLAATVADGVATIQLSGTHEAETIVGTLVFPPVDESIGSSSQVRAVLAQSVFFNAAGSKATTVISREHTIGVIQASLAAVEIDCATLAIRVVKESVETVISGAQWRTTTNSYTTDGFWNKSLTTASGGSTPGTVTQDTVLFSDYDGDNLIACFSRVVLPSEGTSTVTGSDDSGSYRDNDGGVFGHYRTLTYTTAYTVPLGQASAEFINADTGLEVFPPVAFAVQPATQGTTTITITEPENIETAPATSWVTATYSYSNVAYSIGQQVYAVKIVDGDVRFGTLVVALQQEFSSSDATSTYSHSYEVDNNGTKQPIYGVVTSSTATLVNSVRVITEAEAFSTTVNQSNDEHHTTQAATPGVVTNFDQIPFLNYSNAGGEETAYLRKVLSGAQWSTNASFRSAALAGVAGGTYNGDKIAYVQYRMYGPQGERGAEYQGFVSNVGGIVSTAPTLNKAYAPDATDRALVNPIFLPTKVTL